MREMMFDLETLDTRPSCIVLSIGAVIWETFQQREHSMEAGALVGGKLEWRVLHRFYRILDIQSQADRKRTVSESTIVWWQRQGANARDEAFSAVRQPVTGVLNDFREWARVAGDLNAFWANPATFDFPIWEDLAMTFSAYVPWSYRQKYDVRTAVREASYSAKNHQPSRPIDGVPHLPVYDCEWQIDMLHAARVKAGRRVA